MRLIVSSKASSRRLDSTVSRADPGRSGEIDLALVALEVLGGAGGGKGGGAFPVGRGPAEAGLKATPDDLAVDPTGGVGAPGAAGVAAGVAGAAVGVAAPATISLDSLFAITGAPNSSVRSTVCGRTDFTSKNPCLT